MSSASEPLALGIVQPWDCDVMGHFTVRRYAAAFDDASYQLIYRMSGAAPVAGDTIGWADVRQIYEYHSEMRPGDMFAITGSPAILGTRSVTVDYAMHRRESGDLVATMRSTLVRFDLVARTSTSIDDPMRERIAAMIGDPSSPGG